MTNVYDREKLAATVATPGWEVVQRIALDKIGRRKDTLLVCEPEELKAFQARIDEIQGLFRDIDKEVSKIKKEDKDDERDNTIDL